MATKEMHHRVIAVVLVFCFCLLAAGVGIQIARSTEEKKESAKSLSTIIEENNCLQVNSAVNGEGETSRIVNIYRCPDGFYIFN